MQPIACGRMRASCQQLWINTPGRQQVGCEPLKKVTAVIKSTVLLSFSIEVYAIASGQQTAASFSRKSGG
jgi:hypothetical protein